MPTTRSGAGPSVLVIGDPHAHPKYDNRRFTALGKLIAREQPDIIVCIGDFADMPSLSSYDRGTRGFEGQRYRRDLEATWKALDALHTPFARKRGYRPRLEMVLGNHEDRIERATQAHAELHGTIGIDDLRYAEYGWNVTPFRYTVTIQGVAFSHYFASGVSGRPSTSVNPARTQVLKAFASCVSGHSHLFDAYMLPAVDGHQFWSFVVGCYTHRAYDEPWCADTRRFWWRGIVMLEGVQHGEISGFRTWSAERIKRDG